MPVYKGSNEVSSGNLKKGSTNIENGYKQTDQFYVNTNAIIINFVDAISGATMDTTQFSSTGTPGSSFTPFTRTITTDSGRIFQGTVTVAESGDTGGNVSASISGQGSTTATLNVSGTHPNTGVTVTLTVNGATQVQLPNLNVVANENNAVFSTSDGVNLGTFNYSTSQSVSGGGTCSGGTGNSSGTLSSASSSSYTWYGFSAGYPAGGAFGNGCGVTCTSSVSASKSGYNSGSGSFSNTGANPSFTNTYYWNPSGGFPNGSYNVYGQPQTGSGTCPTCVGPPSCTGTINGLLVAKIDPVAGGPAWRISNIDQSSYTVASPTGITDGQTFTNAVNPANIVWPSNGSLSLTNQGSKTGGNVTGIQGIIYYTNPNGSTRGGFYYSVSGTGSSGGTCSGSNFIGNWSSGTSKSFNATCGGNMSGTFSLSMTITTSSPNIGSFGSTTWSL